MHRTSTSRYSSQLEQKVYLINMHLLSLCSGPAVARLLQTVQMDKDVCTSTSTVSEKQSIATHVA